MDSVARVPLTYMCITDKIPRC